MTNWENNKQTSTQKMVGMADFFYQIKDLSDYS